MGIAFFISDLRNSGATAPIDLHSYFLSNQMFQKAVKCIRGMRDTHSKVMESAPMLTVFVDEASPPARFVLMTAAALDIPLTVHAIDLFKGENRSDFFRQINPLMKVPALKINDQVIVESHAIALYLCEHFGGQKLLPEDSIVRARVHQMMFFNCSSLFPIDSAIFCDYFAMKSSINEKQISDWYAALDFLEIHLKMSQWLSHDTVTLSDLCCGATVSSLQLLVPPIERHENVNRWLKNLQKLPCFAINTRGLTRLRSMVDTIRQ